MTVLPFEKRSRKSLFAGFCFLAIGISAYVLSLKSDTDLIGELNGDFRDGITANLISEDPSKPCEALQPAWLAVVARASQKRNARSAADLTSRSFADLAGEAKLSNDLKYKCLQKLVVATEPAEQNLRDGVLLRRMRKITSDQLALSAVDASLEQNAKALILKASEQTAKIESVKAQIKSAYVLKGRLIRQREKGVYEIADEKGHLGLLKTSTTLFEKKGPFALSARKTGSLDVKLSEADGGFDTKWSVWEEASNAQSLEKSLAPLRAELAAMKKTIADNEAKSRVSEKRHQASMKKSFAAIVTEYDGLTGRSMQEMTAN